MTTTCNPAAHLDGFPAARLSGPPRVQVRFDAALSPPPQCCEDLTSRFCSFRFGAAYGARAGAFTSFVSDRQAHLYSAAKPTFL